jgi:flagellar hook-associated protein 1 FlgK
MAFEGLHISQSGIAASQRALDVIGQNIANVGTPGHTRLRVDQVSAERAGPSLFLGPGANGTGVRITGVSRVRDAVLDAGVRSELANSGGADVLANSLARIETVVGPLDGSIADALTSFWNGWEELSLDPTSATARAQVIDASEQLSRSIQRAADGVAEIRDAGESAAASLLDEKQATIEEVARLNGEIRSQQAVGDNPNALLDQRDLHLDSLAESLGAVVHHLEDGSVNVSVGGYEVIRGTQISGLTVSGTPAGLQTSEGVTIVPGGEIGAHLIGGRAAADQAIAELDALALVLRDTVNAEHANGFTAAGVAGGAVFSATSAADFSVDAALDLDGLAASAAGEAADGNHAIAMAGLRDLDTGSGTIDSQTRALIGRVGTATAAAGARAEMNESILNGIRDERASVSGVNLDEELTMLLQYQRAYEASARVLTSVDEMLNVLINRTGLVGR